MTDNPTTLDNLARLLAQARELLGALPPEARDNDLYQSIKDLMHEMYGQGPHKYFYCLSDSEFKKKYYPVYSRRRQQGEKYV